MTTAFTAPCALSASPFSGVRVQHSSPTSTTGPRMSVADLYIAQAAVRDGKQAGAPFGEYQPQCTEGASSGAAYSRRVAVLSREFRLRQASASAKFADLYATRREAMCLADGKHFAEQSAVKFPAAAASKVLSARETALACDRYFKYSTDVEEYMWKCVKKQYTSALSCANGVFGTSCADGAAKGQADDARVAALSAEYTAGMLSTSQLSASMFNSTKFALATARGCHYEEEQFVAYPKMAAAIKGLTTGAYAASVGGATNAGASSVGQVGKVQPLALRLKGINAETLFPNSKIRAAVTKKRMPWETTTIPSYAYMSEAAVAFGVKAQIERFDDKAIFTDKWSSGWKPASKSEKSYATA